MEDDGKKTQLKLLIREYVNINQVNRLSPKHVHLGEIEVKINVCLGIECKATVVFFCNGWNKYGFHRICCGVFVVPCSQIYRLTALLVLLFEET